MAPVIYDLTIGVYIRALTQLSVVLEKGEQHAAQNGAATPEGLIQSRLAPDMFQLPFQVHQACNTALSTLDERKDRKTHAPEKVEDDSFANMQQYIRETLDILKAVKPETWEGKENTEIFIEGRVENWDVEMIPYMQSYGLPNFWFHVVTAYAILRNQGVQIGKPDFLGPRKHIFKVRKEGEAQS